MNVVYLLVHKIRLEENNPPYYYIGSKYKWKGDKTYYSSSSHSIIKEGYFDDLVFTPIWTSEDCSKEELLEKEREYQVLHDVIKNPLFFNRNIANSFIFLENNTEARIEKFKIKANSLNEYGIPYSKVWAERGQKAKDKRYSKEYLSELGKLNMQKMHESGKTVCEVVHDRMMSTMNKVGEDGLTGFQRAGKELSKVLMSVDINTGMTLAQKRAYFGNKNTRVELFDICFFNTKHFCEYFGFCPQVLYNIRNNNSCSEKSYQILVNKLGEDYVSKFNIKIKNPGSDNTIALCGETFTDWKVVMKVLGVTQWAVNEMARTGKPNKKLKKSMIDYFGENKYYRYYPE